MILNIDPAGVAGFTAEDRYWFGKLLQVFPEAERNEFSAFLHLVRHRFMNHVFPQIRHVLVLDFTADNRTHGVQQF